jgi:glycosyltransferase involved in cell wall biosynthesis
VLNRGSSRTELKTLVVGGEYLEIEGVPYVPERCWRMVRIFSDHLASPIFARRRDFSGETSVYSTRFPCPEDLLTLNPSPNVKPWEGILPEGPWKRRWYEQQLSKCDAVYCRFPSWEAMRLYDFALAREKLVFASIHGDWAGVYEHLANTSSIPKKLAYVRLSRVAHRSLVRVATTSRALFCVGRKLYDRYGVAARAAVTFANYLHRESDVCGREDSCRRPPFRILFVGGLVARKGVEYLLGAVSRLISAGIPVELTLVGTGDQAARLTGYAAELGIRDRVDFRGYVPFGDRLFEVYRESDVFAHPAVAGEGSTKVIVEAMSQGLPVVATDVGSTEFVLEDSAAGLLVPPGDEVALADALRRIISESQLRRELISRGLSFAREVTYDRQRCLVGEALREHVPEVVGVPHYLREAS